MPKVELNRTFLVQQLYYFCSILIKRRKLEDHCDIEASMRSVDESVDFWSVSSRIVTGSSPVLPLTFYSISTIYLVHYQYTVLFCVES